MNKQTTSLDPTVRRGVMRWARREAMGLILYIPFLFWPAGTWNWPMAWVLIAVTAAWIIGTAAVTLPRYPELLAERVGPRKGSKRWDTVILSTIGLLMFAKMLLPAFDKRYGWTASLPLWLQIAGIVVALAGYALVVWATASNAFFAQTVRIQSERGHTVETGGPYRFVRHPSYIGMALAELATAAMLGSWLGLIPGAIAAALYVLRTALEDRTLQAELPGYVEYSQKVRFRLLPGIW